MDFELASRAALADNVSSSMSSSILSSSFVSISLIACVAATSTSFAMKEKKGNELRLDRICGGDSLGVPSVTGRSGPVNSAILLCLSDLSDCLLHSASKQSVTSRGSGMGRARSTCALLFAHAAQSICMTYFVNISRTSPVRASTSETCNSPAASAAIFLRICSRSRLNEPSSPAHKSR